MAFSLSLTSVYGKPNTLKVGRNSAVLKSSSPDLYMRGAMDRVARPTRQRGDVLTSATELTV